MPRRARLDAPGTLHHVIVRGIERRRIVNNVADRKNFFERLGELVGVGAQHQQEVGVVDVGHRDVQWAPEERLAAQHLGQLIHAGGGEAPAAAQRLENGLGVEQGAQVEQGSLIAQLGEGKADNGETQ